jgi:hypothetical protein
MVMTIAEDMKKLTENIIISNDVRLKALGALVSGTHRTLEGFSKDRRKMAARQTGDLAAFMNGLSRNVQGLLKSARGMVQQFHKDSKQMSKEQAKNLAAFVNDLVSGVGSMLDGFQKDHKHISRELRDKLAREISGIQRDVERVLTDADELVGQFGADMTRAKKSWNSMSAALTRARRAGLLTPQIDAAERVSTVKQALRKGPGKKKSSAKDGSRRRKVASGV